MNGDELPGEDNVVRYASPRLILSDGTVDGAAFRLRDGESSLSVNWLDHFQMLTKSQQLEEVRRLIHMQLKPRGTFAELIVGITQEYASQSRIDLRFIHRPRAADRDRQADPSHAEIQVEFMTGRPDVSFLGDIIAETVQARHPAVVSTN